MNKGLDHLPFEIISLIFQYLDFRSLINIMTLNSLYFQMSSQFILSGQFYKEDDIDEINENINYNNNIYNNNKFKIPEEQCIFIITKLLQFQSKNIFYLTRIDLTNFNIINKKDEIFELIINLIKINDCNELIIDFTFFTEKQEILFKSICKNLTFLKAKEMSYSFIEFISENKENNSLQHLYINYLPDSFTNYNFFKNLKSLELTLSLSIVNEKFYNFFTKGLINMNKIEELNINFDLQNLHYSGISTLNINLTLDFIKSFENCKNLKKLSFISSQSYTTVLNWCLFEENKIVKYLKEKKTIFQNLKELKLILKVTEESQQFLKYFINKNINLDKLHITYQINENLNKLIKRINKVNELKIFCNSHDYNNNLDIFNNLDNLNNKLIEVNKLIIQGTFYSNHFIKLLNKLKLKELFIVNSSIAYDYQPSGIYNLKLLNELQTIYISKSRIFIPFLECLIKKSKNNLKKLTLQQSELDSNKSEFYDALTFEKESIEKLKKQLNKKKELKNLRYLKIESCKNDYVLFFVFLLQYNLANLIKYFINDCYKIKGSLLEYSFTKIKMSNLIELELSGSPFDDNLMLNMLNFLQNNKIKLNLDGPITENGLISIPKEIRKKIVQLKLYNSKINLNQNENDMIDFLNDLNDELTVCCLNFREFGPTNQILKTISNKFKELKILNIQGKVEIEKQDLFDLVNQLEKIELIYFESVVNNCTMEELEEFKKSIRLRNRLAPKIIVRMKSNMLSSSKQIVRNPPAFQCLLM
ncbi:hypothetical protein ABK040_013450 [Willaertia magna]